MSKTIKLQEVFLFFKGKLEKVLGKGNIEREFVFLRTGILEWI